VLENLLGGALGFLHTELADHRLLAYLHGGTQDQRRADADEHEHDQQQGG